MTGPQAMPKVGSPSGHRRSLIGVAFVLLSLVLLSSCMVGPNYKRPTVNTPATFGGGSDSAAQQNSLADLPWWQVFKDETLRGLIKTSLANNYDLNVAIVRVEEVREAAAQARAQYLPTVNYQVTLTNGQNQFLGSPASNSSGAQTFFLGVATASWEIDLWGRLRRLNEGARAQFLSAEYARRGVMLTVVSEVAQGYYQLLGLQLQLAIARSAANTFAESLELFKERMSGGVSSQLPVSRAAADQATAAAQVFELERQIALAQYQINVLLGRNPGPIETDMNLLSKTVPPEVPAGLPSALLERRPDLRAAEENVRYANAQIGVATAAYFPAIGLTTFLGKLSTPVSDITSGRTNVWSAGANIAGPIYQGGALRAKKRQAVAAWQEAQLLYQQSALSAFQDVSSALISREKYNAIHAQQTVAVQALLRSADLANKRYRAGFASYYEVLEAEQQLYPAQVALAQTELNQRLVIVQLYKALGGGWNLKDAEWQSPNTPREVSANRPELKSYNSSAGQGRP